MNEGMRSQQGAPKVMVLSCGCICRRYDGKMVVVHKTCTHHRVHPDFVK